MFQFLPTPPIYSIVAQKSKSSYAQLLNVCCIFILLIADINVSAEEYRIGVLAYRGESQAMEAWVNTGEYLNKELSPDKFLIVPYNLAQMKNAIVNKEIDFAITQATHFVSMETQFGISRIATIKRHYQGSDFTKYAAVIITKSNRSDINSIADLHNKKFVGVNGSALGGWQMAALEFDRQKVVPSNVEFVGLPQSNVVFAVRDKLADAGSVRARAFYELADKGMIDKSDFKVIKPKMTVGYPFIHSTDLYPEWPIAKLSHTPKVVSEAVVNALLALDMNHPAAISASISGWTVPLDYKSIYDLMQQLEIEPFNKHESPKSQVKTTEVVAVLLLVFGALSLYFLQRINRQRVTIDNVQQQNIVENDNDIIPSLLKTTALSVIETAIVILDDRGRIVYLNKCAKQLFDVQGDGLLGDYPSSVLTYDSESPEVSEEFLTKPELMHHPEKSATLVTSSGLSLEVDVETQELCDESGIWIGTVLVLNDRTRANKLQKKVLYQASHDALTGLLNRREFESQLQEVLNNLSSAKSTYTMLYLDLDQFKLVNDSCGHIAGDELLKQVSQNMINITKNGEQIARIGGDEFAILLCNCDLSQATQISERIRNSLDELRFVWQDKVFDIAVSIGVLPITDRYITVIDVFSDADAACYAAKNSGRNRIHVYAEDDNIIRKRRNEVQWAQELKFALEYNKFELCCQPILSLKNQEVDVWYLEVLVRMVDRQGNRVMPMAFIPAAERYHQMPLIDKWVVRKTVEDLLVFSDAQLNSVRCFINISGQTISDVSFLGFVRELLATTKLNPTCLCFEITETATIANFKQAAKLISVLQKLGCHFALDDFGTGLSSFSYLKQLPVDYIKIDGSFIRNMADDPVAKAIVDAISNICHTMNIEAIAEFVETESILSNVKSVDLDYIQGNIVGKPIPLLEMLNKIQYEQQVAAKPDLL